ncbi:MAG TPA: acyl carrier protein [Candidatus Gemmiger excrementigallinarum]|uniref:Acyl carrier protein n=1 Tax=Candidatus Gemmiger excrementigallinarum TaxID=2838609 RepID=A0A9D2JAG5_9FIRM|nr:acyl carrier protein [Candidatus Gemmiger excrementigallinarum]
MHTLDEIMKILAEVKPGIEAEPDTELVRTGILDSVDIMSVVMALAEEFDLEISPLDLKEENFHTPNAILDLVNRLDD